MIHGLLYAQIYKYHPTLSGSVCRYLSICVSLSLSLSLCLFLCLSLSLIYYNYSSVCIFHKYKYIPIELEYEPLKHWSQMIAPASLLSFAPSLDTLLLKRNEIEVQNLTLEQIAWIVCQQLWAQCNLLVCFRVREMFFNLTISKRDGICLKVLFVQPS